MLLQFRQLGFQSETELFERVAPLPFLVLVTGGRRELRVNALRRRAVHAELGIPPLPVAPEWGYRVTQGQRSKH